MLRGSTQELESSPLVRREIDRSPCYRTEDKHLLWIIGALFVERYWTRDSEYIVDESLRVVFNRNGVLTCHRWKRHAIHVDREEKGSRPTIIFIVSLSVSMVTYCFYVLYITLRIVKLKQLHRESNNLRSTLPSSRAYVIGFFFLNLINIAF